MITIRKKLAAGFLISSIITITFVIIFVNIVINNKFRSYMNEVQNKRYIIIVNYFEEIYKKEGGFNENSGEELMHEAYMSNYCLTLMDDDKNIIWEMDPSYVDDIVYFNNKHKGIYTTKDFELKYENKTIGYVRIGQYAPVLLTKEDANFITSINRSILISTILTVTIGGIISIYLAKQFSKPISEVAKMSNELSQGNFNVKSNDNTKIKEIYDLKNNMDILSERLKNQEVLRRQLVSDISHEIRTPLNILQNNLEAMIDGVFLIDKNRLEQLNSEVIRFGRLLENLDVLKGFDSESDSFNISNVNLRILLTQIYDEFKINAKDKNIKFTLNIIKAENYIVNGDEDKLRQVFINLLNNSIKFTPPKGKIDIYLKVKCSRIIFIIKDTGIGISNEDLPYIFERLYRGDKSRNAIEGKGIGLAIVRSILEKHNAKIFVESKLGEGSIFKIIFETI